MSLASLTTARIPLNVDSSGVAIQGCDPVAFFTDSRPFKGSLADRAGSEVDDYDQHRDYANQTTLTLISHLRSRQDLHWKMSVAGQA
jgi:hypothetical protein